MLWQCLRCIKEALYKDRRVRITNVRFAFMGGLPFDVKPRTEGWRALLHTADTLGGKGKDRGGGRRKKEEERDMDPYQVTVEAAAYLIGCVRLFKISGWIARDVPFLSPCSSLVLSLYVIPSLSQSFSSFIHLTLHSFIPLPLPNLTGQGRRKARADLCQGAATQRQHRPRSSNR